MQEYRKSKQQFEYTSYEEGQRLEKERQEKLEKIRKGVQKNVAELKRETTEAGEPKYDFELIETSDLVIIKKGESEIRMPKAMAADPKELRKSVEELHNKKSGE